MSITESGSNASSFSYAPDKHRYYQSAVINGATETTVYVGAFEAVTTGGTTTYRYHLSADSREVAEVDLSNSGSSVIEKISYVLSDHLGSTDVVQTTDVNGNVLSTTDMSFGAFGNRREPNTWLPPVTQAEAQADHNADRYGFTHQEMLDNVGIVHMNGRIYDPNLGRFLSVDPVFEFPTNTQSLNPYSYVLNNPLSMTDPTGYVAACGTGKASCPDSESGSVTVKTTAHELGSHIATHGMTTITLTKEANGNTVMSASGNGFGLGETAEVSVDSHGGGNGVQTSQGMADAQNKPDGSAGINSPSTVAKQDATQTGGVSNAAQQLGDTGAGTGKQSTADERQQTVDDAVKVLASKGLFGNHELVFDNKFATVDTKKDGSLDMSSLQTFRTLSEADKDAAINSDANESPLEGNTGLGSKRSTIYAGAVMAGIISGRTGQPIPMNALLHTEFVILHEFAHGNGIRDERAADIDALRKLGLWR